MNDIQKSPERVFVHDIATPIAVALGMVDLVMDDSKSGAVALPDVAAKRLEKAQSALLQLQQLIADRRKAILEPSTTT
jgi:signal transduction histidine kinase